MGEENRDETVSPKVTTRPGRNGGTLKNDAGPGRPKGSLGLTERLRNALMDDDAEAESLIRDTIKNAKAGNGVALKLVWDRVEGPLKEALELSFDLSGLSVEELQQLAAIQSKIAAK